MELVTEPENLVEVGAPPYAETLEKIVSKLNTSARHHLEDEFIRYALDSAAIVVNTDVQGTITYTDKFDTGRFEAGNQLMRESTFPRMTPSLAFHSLDRWK